MRPMAVTDSDRSAQVGIFYRGIPIIGSDEHILKMASQLNAVGKWTWQSRIAIRFRTCQSPTRAF